MAVETLKRQTGFGEGLSNMQMRAQNPDLYNPNFPRLYPPHRMIHIYSVSKRSFDLKHVYFKGTLKACKDGERFVKCCSIPDPPQMLGDDVERGGKRVEVEPGENAGWRVAIDILNPNNPTLDPYFKMDGKMAAYFATGQNVDMVKFGLFPSLNDPPTEEELKRAEKAREESDQALIDEAFAEQASNPQGFRVWLKSHPEIYDVMESHGVEADWAKKQDRKMTCPNCGDVVKSGIAFHKSSAGVLCVIDRERAIAAGAITRGPGRPPKED